jgi:hypothetical protein
MYLFYDGRKCIFISQLQSTNVESGARSGPGSGGEIMDSSDKTVRIRIPNTDREARILYPAKFRLTRIVLLSTMCTDWVRILQIYNQYIKPFTGVWRWGSLFLRKPEKFLEYRNRNF